MNIEDLKLRLDCMLRRAGLAKVPKAALAGIGVLCLALIALSAWHFWPGRQVECGDDFEMEAQAQEAEDTQLGGQVVVDLEGAVANPGLYSFSQGTRLGEAVEAAGGMTEDAVRTSVNLASVLEDGQQVIIPTGQDTQETAASSVSQEQGSQDSGKVNINTASAQELQSLSGVGEVLSQRIVDYRQANGQYASIEDLQNVSGIGQTRFEQLKDQICV